MTNEAAITGPFGRWVDIGQIVEALGISRRSLERLIATGRFPRPVKIGRQNRWPEDVVQDHLQALRVKAAS